MGIIKIKQGLDLPITGSPDQEVLDSKSVKKVALLGDDYVNMKPTMLVQEGDRVKLGQALFTDKKHPSIKFTSPGAGKVVAVNRGERRVFQSLVIELEGNEEITFKSYTEEELKSLSVEKVKEQLLESGLWTSLRARPYSSVANPDSIAHSIFINAMDTNPLAPLVPKLLKGAESDLKTGLGLLSKLTEGNLYYCLAADDSSAITGIERLSVEKFEGPHPAGLSGTHIHFLDPVGRKKTVWYINAEDVVRIGQLFTTGKINVEKTVALAGPSLLKPKLIKTRIGACISEITFGELKEGENRAISGSVLSGHKASEVFDFLGFYHRQISVLPEDRSREFFGWAMPQAGKYSIKNVVMSKLMPGKKFDFGTNIHGGERAIVPIGSYEKVMPLDILPTYLLRALSVDDVEEAEKLGCLELDEEDLALCTFVCPSKNEYGPILRRNLTLIEKEG